MNKKSEKLASLEAEHFSLMQKGIEKYPAEFAKYFFEALLQKGDLINNPFNSFFNKKGIDGEQRLYGDLAQIVINKIEDYRREESEYTPLTQVIEDEFYFDKSDIRLSSSRTKSLREFKLDLISKLEENFGVAVLFVHIYVYQGVPLYIKNDLNEFTEVSESDPRFVYIFMNGHYQSLSSRGDYPEWVREFFFRNEHLEFHKHFFSGFEGDDETLKIRRKAFREAICRKDICICTYETDKSASNVVFDHHDTKLMRIQKEVLNRFYGELFDINDSDTWTTQNVVVEWLIAEFGLSKREAEAIDMVTRPDQARGK